MSSTIINYNETDIVTSGSFIANSGNFNNLQVNNTAVILDGDIRLTDSRPPTPHIHEIVDVSGLITELSSKQPIITAGTGLPVGGNNGDIYIQYS